MQDESVSSFGAVLACLLQEGAEGTSGRRQAALRVAELCYQQPHHQAALGRDASVRQLLLTLLGNDDQAGRAAAAHALANLCFSFPQGAETFGQDAEILAAVLQLLQDGPPAGQRWAARAIASLCASPVVQSKLLCNNDVVAALTKLLVDGPGGGGAQAAKAVASLCRGNAANQEHLAKQESLLLALIVLIVQGDPTSKRFAGQARLEAVRAVASLGMERQACDSAWPRRRRWWPPWWLPRTVRMWLCV